MSVFHPKTSRVNMKRTIVLFCSLLINVQLMSQGNTEPKLTQFEFLQYTSELPEDFLSTKTAVFISVPADAKKPRERGDWKALSEKVHQQFRKMGIDAVAYYYMDDLVSGQDPRIAFTKEMAKRKIANIILCTQSNTSGTGAGSAKFSIIATPFNGKLTILSNGQKAYRMENDDLNQLMVNMGKDIYRSKQSKTNFMIMDVPEFFTSADIINGRRFPIYAKDLKVDKLAVPLFQKIPVPSEEEQGPDSERTAQEISQHNNKIEASNERLKALMTTYPLKYEITEKYKDEDLYNTGYDYVLLKLYTTGITIRELLGYQIDTSETDYITVKSKDGFTSLQRIPVNTPVHKYYVKHLYTKDIYVGGKWDADETWHEALQNFIHNMLDALKVKR